MLAQNTDFVGVPSAISINNNISAAPQVANQRIGDFRLEPQSPCVNEGLTASVVNNLIAANGADSGGGLALVDTPPAAGAGGALVVNNTIVANSGSGIFFANASPTNINNLIAFNSAGLERFGLQHDAGLARSEWEPASHGLRG